MDSATHAQILALLDRTTDMSFATVRPDGFPQATVVAFVHDDLTLYFTTAPDAQKVRNIAACDKVSLTITAPYTTWQEIEGVSIGGRARLVTDPGEIDLATGLFRARYPEVADAIAEMPGPPTLIRTDPAVISLIDYSRGFGHTRLIELPGPVPAG
ncbi:pyridoxamine 5'-phosphate oxidase family protein [Ovoidimarina sediminis]|uniref:pyridoxamine 5'-phosphate oxidase family protein n=1 Tax=Ovoidimarina sediminis TaxID=3079856 RepID=UPI002908E770|nr:pyridoxamine 5'-phosphate oxidase family protein [Rhodophyticola sp. MJ-SS7]MDU8942367.1 pyridoxamine 5'-phosphate oxidase family protein [Rhodophyticola sp. MJ-SS7]